MELSELRKKAKDAGVARYWKKSKETLLKELEINDSEPENNDKTIIDSVPAVEPEEIKIVSMNESEDLQRSGWRVFAIEVRDNKTIHKLKRVSEG